MVAISALRAVFTSRCRARVVFLVNCGDTISAEKACPHPPVLVRLVSFLRGMGLRGDERKERVYVPDMSSISTWLASSLSIIVVLREDSVTEEASAILGEPKG